MGIDILRDELARGVPLWIGALQKSGGPGALTTENRLAMAQLIAEKGDILLFGSKKKGEREKVLNAVAGAMALLSFCPGGVTAFGQHYETRPNGVDHG